MADTLLVSVIIPVWRDEQAVTVTLQRLQGAPNVEVIVAFPLGEDSRYRSLQRQHPDVQWVQAPRGRAAQMNAGAAVSRGRWFVFLHADSELPRDWLGVIAEADTSADIVAGAFRLAFDSRDWRARLIERGVRLRVALFGLPYGDQALFVRRRTFEALGGYRDLPLMEDVDFVRRVRNTGRLVNLSSAVITSARRWERDGWLRRSAQNVGLATRFLFGASPSKLAQQYFGRKAAAIVMMARAPWTGGKTRLAGGMGEGRHADLRHALFLDTLDVVTSVAGVEHIIASEPLDACERMREFVGPTIDVVAQRGTDLGQRMASVFEDVFRLGVESIVVVGSDLPDLPSRLLKEAVAALSGPQDRIVLGPATDGGYYLIGMNRLHRPLFEAIDWSTDRVLSQTLESARARDVPVVRLEQWADIDDAVDLARLIERPDNAVAARPARGASRTWPATTADCLTSAHKVAALRAGGSTRDRPPPPVRCPRLL
jgi:rSAM/selenodomain-associated transferase 2/rSAM/selenodomain-associated transferase 1